MNRRSNKPAIVEDMYEVVIDKMSIYEESLGWGVQPESHRGGVLRQVGPALCVPPPDVNAHFLLRFRDVIQQRLRFIKFS